MIHSRKVTALVPMKANSERVKNKNIRPFCGKPLYHHILQTLDKTYAIDEIIINTDSDQIAAEAPTLSKKIKIHIRPEAIRGDFVSMNRIIEDDISRGETDIVLQTHSTNPLLRSESITKALKAFVENEEKDSLFSVNVYQSRFYGADGKAVNHNPEELLRTQDLPPLYEENSNIYIFTKESFAKKQRRIGENPVLFPTPWIESIDIDNEYTFRLAELLAGYAAHMETD